MVKSSMMTSITKQRRKESMFKILFITFYFLGIFGTLNVLKVLVPSTLAVTVSSLPITIREALSQLLVTSIGLIVTWHLIFKRVLQGVLHDEHDDHESNLHPQDFLRNLHLNECLFLAILSFILVNMLLGELILPMVVKKPPSLQQVAHYREPTTVFLLLISSVFISPLLEEMIFRLGFHHVLTTLKFRSIVARIFLFNMFFWSFHVAINRYEVNIWLYFIIFMALMTNSTFISIAFYCNAPKNLRVNSLTAYSRAVIVHSLLNAFINVRFLLLQNNLTILDDLFKLILFLTMTCQVMFFILRKKSLPRVRSRRQKMRPSESRKFESKKLRVSELVKIYFPSFAFVFLVHHLLLEYFILPRIQDEWIFLLGYIMINLGNFTVLSVILELLSRIRGQNQKISPFQ